MSDPIQFFEKVYVIVRLIPKGKVTSYGRIAEMLDAPRGARAVGYAMRGLKHKEGNPTYEGIPWQRVVNAQGRLSIPNVGKHIQKELLEEEGIMISKDFKIDLKKYLWEGLLPHEVEKFLS